MRVAIFRDGRLLTVSDRGDRLEAGAYARAFVDGAVTQAGDVLACRVTAYPLDGDTGLYGYERLMREDVGDLESNRAIEAGGTP